MGKQTLIPALLIMSFAFGGEIVLAQPLNDSTDLTHRRWYTLKREEMATVVVNGVTITHGDVEDRMKVLRRADYFAPHKQYEDMKPGEYRQFVRDLLIDEVVAVQEAMKLGIKVELGEVSQAAGAYLGEDTKEARLKTLRSGYTGEEIVDGMAVNVMINRLRGEVCATMPLPTTEEMRAFYEANREVFQATPERVLARRIHLVIPEFPEDEEGDTSPQAARQFQEDALRVVGDEASEFLRELREGKDFKSLADRHTEDPRGIGSGGSLGWVTRGSLKNPPLEEIVFSQEIGKLPNEPALVDDGYSIVLVEDHQPPVYQPFEEVLPRILQGIQIDFFKEWLAEKRRNARIDYYEDLPMARVLEGDRPKKTYLK